LWKERLESSILEALKIDLLAVRLRPLLASLASCPPDEISEDPLDHAVAHLDGVFSDFPTGLAASFAHLHIRRVEVETGAGRSVDSHTVDLNTFAEGCPREAVANSPDKPFPYSYWYVLKRWMTTREAAGFPDVRIHDLRHSFARTSSTPARPSMSSVTWLRTAPERRWSASNNESERP